MKTYKSPPPSTFKPFYFSYFILLIIFLSGCSKEAELTALPVGEEINEAIQVKFLHENSIPYLKQEVNKLFLEPGKKSPDKFYLNRNKVMQVTDSLGNKTYSYQLIIPETPSNTFYNLVWDDKNKLRVFEYEVTPGQLENFILNNFDLANFVGRISYYPGNKFLEAIGKNEKRFVAPCDTYEITETEGIVESGGSGNDAGSGDPTLGDNGEPIGSGGTGNTGGDYSSGGSYVCKWDVVTETPKCHEPGYAGTCDGPQNVTNLVINCQPQTRSSTDCPETSATYGMNFYEYGLYNLMINFNLNAEQLNWLHKEENQTFMVKLFFYARSNEYNEQAENFSLEAVNAKMAGGEVDFEEEIINMLVGRALCIYKKLQNTDLFTNILNGFRNEENLKLTLKIGTLADCSNQAGAEGCTDGRTIDVDGRVTIYIINQNVPYLEMANNLIHEGVHAELYKFVHTNNSSVLDATDKRRVMDYYLYYKGVAEQGFMDLGHVASAYQHEYMAENFVTPIAKAIKELDNNRFDLSYYMWYGWEGLENTYQFKNRLSEAQKADYINKKNQVNATTGINCN